ncbi:transcriptional regulator [Nocardia sp. ET3-3]|uniref:Transcriptional regulator n=1 Tax=Nocardia terrae TaxID=2675851 RepID=A0A7K1UU97_9NOCA|nr:DUF5753 domain-containing protein [Nocardia terrae]MVU77885.1 transcriptional regulator [Nocardia terrae]
MGRIAGQALSHNRPGATGNTGSRVLFVAKLGELWKVAGNPTLHRVARAVALRMRATSARGSCQSVSIQRISDWRAGRNVPARFESLAPVLLTLVELADPTPRRELSDLGAWRRLWKAARTEADSLTPAATRPPCRRRSASPPRTDAYLGLEQTATLVRAFECHLVPELLQTDDYARAIIALDYWSRSEKLRRIELRRKRRELLDPCGGPTVWAVLDEAVLYRPVGGTHVLRGQLEHLLELSARPNVIIQVLPLRAGGCAALGTSFTMLRFAERTFPDVVYLPQPTGAAHLERRPDEVDTYRKAMDRLAQQAESRERSRSRLIAAAAGLRQGPIPA